MDLGMQTCLQTLMRSDLAVHSRHINADKLIERLSSLSLIEKSTVSPEGLVKYQISKVIKSRVSLNIPRRSPFPHIIY